MLTVSKADTAAEGKFKSRQYTFNSDVIQKIEDAYYLMLNRSLISVRRLLTAQSTSHEDTGHADDGIVNMGKTDIVDQLCAIRQKTVKLHICGGDTDKVDKVCSKKQWYNRKGVQAALAEKPETIVIQTPQVGDLAPIAMRVITDLKGPLWIEVSDATLTWLTKAVDIQVRSGTVRSRRSTKSLDDTGADGAFGADDSDDTDGSDGAGTTHVAAGTEQVVAVLPPPMPKRSPTPEPKPTMKKAKLTDYFRKAT